MMCEAVALPEACDDVLPVVEDVLRDYELAHDYRALVVAESNCKTKATSKAGARGAWQMMRPTMRTYGCTDAEDLVCQTEAAAKYLKHLEDLCKGDIRCVIESWNMGWHNRKQRGSTAEARGLYWKYIKVKKELEN